MPEWNYTPESSWVHSYRRDPIDMTLVVRYKDRTGNIEATCIYSDATGTLFDELQRAPSKGKYVHARLFYLPYKPG